MALPIRPPSRKMLHMKQRNLLVGILIALVAAAAAGLSHAEDPCRAKCDEWIATCKRTCADAPVPDECRANCVKADRQCLDNCADGD
jgi:hypothetical protein